jgi:hypothetical protein
MEICRRQCRQIREGEEGEGRRTIRDSGVVIGKSSRAMKLRSQSRRGSGPLSEPESCDGWIAGNDIQGGFVLPTYCPKTDSSSTSRHPLENC